MLPRDNQGAFDDTKEAGMTQSNYEILGCFEPRDAKRILEELEQQHLSFEVKECSDIQLSSIWRWPRDLLCIYVLREDKEKATAISDQDSVRSRAAAGIRYLAIGGVICTATLLEMRSGVRTMPWHERFGGYTELPLEMVAGIAGIVVFIGFLQLVIATILKLRGRQ